MKHLYLHHYCYTSLKGHSLERTQILAASTVNVCAPSRQRTPQIRTEILGRRGVRIRGGGTTVSIQKHLYSAHT